MFQSTRVKLTMWYVLITMIVSMCFSVFIYENVTREFTRFKGFQKYMKEHPDEIPPPPPRFVRQLKLNNKFIEETEMRIQLTLLGVNLIILGLSGIGGYFLAGLSLKPIKEMIDEQHRFITDASHELRTPLTVLKSEIEVSLRDSKMSLPEAKKILESNLEEVNNLQILTDNLLELASYQSKTNGASYTKLDLAAVAEDAIRKVTKNAEQKQITIENTVAPVFINGNEVSLGRLFIILLDNAIKYSPEGSAVTVSSEKNDGSVKIRVADKGIGIDEKEQSQIFKRFYRSNAARSKKEAAGYGLGLSIAKKIVENHEGSIRVKSVKDQGTTFTITFPTQS